MFDWLQVISDWFVYGILGVTHSSPLGNALNFFIFDTIKILVLLFLITFLMGIINSYFPIDRIKNFLSRHKMYGIEYFIASFFGVVTVCIIFSGYIFNILL
jgi:uncharacterized protein